MLVSRALRIDVLASKGAIKFRTIASRSWVGEDGYGRY